jgi:hypothetical protein
MKVIGTAAIALALLASGSAFAHGDGDGYRRHGHDRGFGRHHERYYGDYGRHTTVVATIDPKRAITQLRYTWLRLLR